jgi:Putative Flp pilus-assembly TadE/G-like
MMLKRFWSNDDGVIAPVTVFFLILLLGFCAFVLDVGTMYAHRRALQNAADAAALAGAQELEAQLLGGTGNPAGQAQTWAARNGVTNISIGAPCTRDHNASVTYNNPSATRPNSWRVTTSRLVHLTFGPFLGISDMCVTANAVAVVTDAIAAKVFPWGLYGSQVSALPFADPAHNQTCNPSSVSTTNPDDYCFVLKVGAGGSSSGNFGMLNFTRSGSKQDYIYWAENGYGSRQGETIPGPIPTKTWTIWTFTGNTANYNDDISTWVQSNVQYPPDRCPGGASATKPYTPDFRCPLIGLLPILQEGSLGTGSSGTVTVINFVIFEIVGVTDDHATGHKSIIGQFLKHAQATGPTLPQDPTGALSGALTIRLQE